MRKLEIFSYSLKYPWLAVAYRKPSFPGVKWNLDSYRKLKVIVILASLSPPYKNY